MPRGSYSAKNNQIVQHFNLNEWAPQTYGHAQFQQRFYCPFFAFARSVG